MYDVYKLCWLEIVNYVCTVVRSDVLSILVLLYFYYFLLIVLHTKTDLRLSTIDVPVGLTFIVNLCCFVFLSAIKFYSIFYIQGDNK